MARLYRKTYFAACEGQQETMYLKHLSRLLKNSERVITFNTVEKGPEEIEKQYFDYDAAALFDYDNNQTEFLNKLKTCEKLAKKNKPSKSKNDRYIYHAYSNVNFDLWLILHKEYFNRPVSSNDAYVADVRRIYSLDREANIKNKDVIEQILAQIMLDDIKKAISHADRIKQSKLDSDIKRQGDIAYYSNPDFSLHEFIRVVLKECGE